MAKTTNAWATQFLTTTIGVEYSSVIYRVSFSSFYSIYDVMYSILCIDLFFHENISTPLHSIQGNSIQSHQW